jgi:hypothetical protein
MAFVKVGPDFIENKIAQLNSQIKSTTLNLEIWKANLALYHVGQDVYVNRQQESIVSERGVLPIEVKAPCRFVKREEIEAMIQLAEITLAIYKQFLEAIDNGDFLMTDDDPDTVGNPGYQLFKKDCPTVNVLSC